MTVVSQMPELDQGGFLPPPKYKLGIQNTPSKLGLTSTLFISKVPFQRYCTFLSVKLHNKRYQVTTLPVVHCQINVK